MKSNKLHDALVLAFETTIKSHAGVAHGGTSTPLTRADVDQILMFAMGTLIHAARLNDLGCEALLVIVDKAWDACADVPMGVPT